MDSAGEIAEVVAPKIALDSDPTVSFASHHNAIPLIHAVKVHNAGAETLRNVEVLIQFDPPVAEPIRRRLDLLAAGEERTLTGIDLTIARKMLAELTEAIHGEIIAELKFGDAVLASIRKPLTVLSFDQWGGTRSVPELLCAFSTPNHPQVDRVLADAGVILADARGNYSLNGYTDKNREAALMQISAIFTALARRNIQYALPPASFVESGQLIRNPERVLTGGVGTCLDTTMLMASCLEQAGLNPIILLKDGHAWVGCWLIKTNFATSITDDVLAVRKRIDAGEMIAIETTLLTHSIPRFAAAREDGLRHFKDEANKFNYAIDIRSARNEKIVPIPAFTDAIKPLPPIERKAIEFDEAVELPPLIGDGILLDDDPIVETPAGRLSRWTSKLLDLTLRNRLLNFKASKATIPLMVVDPASVEDEIADGKEWKFKAMPLAMDGADPRSAAIRRSRDGEDPIAGMIRDFSNQHVLLAGLEEKKLNSALNEIYLTVKTGLEETGANTLFLAIGFLRWAEDERAEKTFLAPLLLVPVTLKRASVRAGFSIVRHDDETIVNPTLLQALRDKHGVTVRGVEPPPADAKGTDVNKVLAIFREAVKEIPRWEVVQDVYLGIFSFHKYVMYVDLKARQEELRKSRIVQHLMDRPQESLAGRDDIRHRDDLDDVCPPDALMAPLSSDSSQLNALRRAQEGRDFVMKGPPGTGKSQTITNLITDFLARGKRVLFVSEKMAALSVVERRLTAVGLGPFCLQLHSAKAAKAEVLSQLKGTLEIGNKAAPEAWAREAEHLSRLRSELNGLVRALHKHHLNGLTVRGAIDIAILHSSWPSIPIDLPAVDQLGAAELARMRELGRASQVVANQIGNLAGHQLRSIRQIDWSHAWESELLSAGGSLRSKILPLRTAIEALHQPLNLKSFVPSLHGLKTLDQLANVLLEAPSIPPGLAANADDPQSRRVLAELRRHGLARNAIWNELSGTFKAEVTRLNPIEIQDAWTIASGKWVVPRWLGQRAAAARFIPYTPTGKRPDPLHTPSLLDKLIRLKSEDDAIKVHEATARTLLDDTYRATETDWAVVARMEDWSKRLSAAVDRFGSADNLHARGDMAQQVVGLVGPHRQMLQASGPIGTRLLQYKDAYSLFAAAFEHATKLADNQELAGIDEYNSSFLDLLESVVGAWQSNQFQIRNWCLWNDYRRQAAAFGLKSALVAIEDGRIPSPAIESFFDYTYQVWWLKDVMDRDEAMRTFNGAVHDQKIRDFQQADATFQQLTKQVVFARLANGISPAGSAESRTGEMAILTREIQKQRAHIPIRKLVKSIPNLLPSLKPCLLMSPLSVAQYLDPSHAQFDVVIFDEASQIPVWDAVGVIARAAQVIVVGDPKQLPPTAFFDKGGDDEEDAIDSGDVAPPKDLESILDECLAIGMPTLSLDWHYRSAHESLIAFSNHRYYDSRLITFPSPVTRDTSVKLVSVNGTYDRGASQTNRAEAEAVVKRVVEHFSQTDIIKRAHTVGVVTFNSKQQRLIDDLLSAELGKHPEIEERMVAHGDERLFIKNLENVQGDERDIILFSTTFGRDSSNRSTMNFGPINQEGGERRLNVAITRARRAVEIFSSLRPEDIDLSKSRAKGVADLKAYLQYALSGPSALAMESSPTGRDPDSPFEMEVISVLRDAGFSVHPQVGCSGYRLDIGVVDQGAPGRYIIGVECDGATYHSMASARDRDRLRQYVLEGLGWTLVRVWSTDWWLNRQQTAATLLLAVRDAQLKADAERAVAV
ncbi:DUF4011 domain-containing protein [Nevskia ramosa]|uniref:DUF4011 domain-containing protein n=1 Tax=Nevskia ramosa TaxID=64002 RepID=UPI003D1252C5